MSKKDVFDGVKAGLMMYDALLLGVAEQFGMERAVALQSKVTEKIGAMQEPLTIKRKTTKNYDARAVEPLVRAAYKGLGSSIKIVEESPHCVLVQCSRCPNYKAAHELGMDPTLIERWCRAGRIKSIETMIKLFNPDLTFRLVRFRSTPEDFCEEEIVELVDLDSSAAFPVDDML
jgi:hypothetical protein